MSESETASGVKSRVFGPEGFSTALRFAPAELETVRSLIRAHWLEQIRRLAPRHADRFAAVEMDRYHELSSLLEHETMWPVKNRILPMSAVAQIRRMSIFPKLEAEFGPFALADVEHVSREEMAWRIVRPGRATDVGPLHADSWFWELNPEKPPAGTRRVKAWTAVHCEPGFGGLRVVAGSHRREWRHFSETRSGALKPQLGEKEETLDVELLRTAPGDVVVFNDDLLHGGGRTTGERTRVSVEFTLLVRSDS